MGTETIIKVKNSAYIQYCSVVLPRLRDRHEIFSRTFYCHICFYCSASLSFEKLNRESLKGLIMSILISASQMQAIPLSRGLPAPTLLIGKAVH
jgi:hypothetical protein